MSSKLDMMIGTPTKKFNVNTSYDITNIKAGKMMVKFHGDKPPLSKFEIMHNGNWNLDSNYIDAKWNMSGYPNDLGRDKTTLDFAFIDYYDTP